MLGDSPIRLMRRASIDGLEIPVTDVKKGSELVYLQARSEQSPADGTMPKLLGGSNPVVIGLTPTPKLGVFVDGQREISPFDANALVQASKDLRLDQPISPVLLESSEQHLLRVVEFGKSAADPDNLHTCIVQSYPRAELID